MKAIENVLPHSPDQKEYILAKDQPEYIPLPIVRITYADSTVSMISRYRFSWRERLKVLFSGCMWIEQMTFGEALQPQRPTVYEPLTKADV